jgi:hypothetical protein
VSNESDSVETSRQKRGPGPELKAGSPLAAAAAIRLRPSIEHRSQSLTRPRHAAAQRDSDAGPIAGLGQVTAFYAKLMGHSAVRSSRHRPEAGAMDQVSGPDRA